MKLQRHTPSILVVDDDVVTNRFIQVILGRSGFRTAGAVTVEQALGTIKETNPDLVVVDVNLPDGSGFEVCRYLQNQGRAVPTPVLFISSDGDLATKIQGFEAGGVDYVTKPLEGTEICARITTHLRLKQASELVMELQADRIRHLVEAQGAIMPTPSDLPEAKFEVSRREIMQAGGDFYDVIPVGEGLTDYVVADASGHDLAASLWTAALKTVLNEYAAAAQRPIQVLRSINSALSRILPEGVFFTMIYARLNRQTGKLLLANAGHPPTLVLGSADAEPSFVAQEGDVIGVFEEATFGVTELPLSPKDRFFLCSDGLLELRGSREEGLAKLAEACTRLRSQPLAETVRQAVEGVVANAVPKDDIVLLGVEV